MDLDFLAFRQTAYHVYGRLFEPLLQQYGLTQMEMDILLFLANNPQYDTAAELVTVRHLAKSQVSTGVEALTVRGYLGRQAEGRRIHLSLLSPAEPVVEAGRVVQRDFLDLLLKGIAPEEQTQLKRLLDQITENARAAYRDIQGGRHAG